MASPLSTFTTVRRVARWGAWAPLLLVLGGCSYLPALPSLQSGDSFLGFITPYRMDIVQGNVVTQEQAALVKSGMTRAQVRDILGSPMLTDLFHADRWDYVFTIKRQGTAPQRRDVIAYFNGDRLDRLEASDLPTEKEFVASISRPLAARAAPVIELTDEQRKALPRPPKTEAEPVLPMGAIRPYPPLEPS
jgi:outer membrane protein assembly factor BamE